MGSFLDHIVLCEKMHNHNVLRSWDGGGGGGGGGMAPLALSPIARSSYNGLTGKYAVYLKGDCSGIFKNYFFG